MSADAKKSLIRQTVRTRRNMLEKDQLKAYGNVLVSQFEEVDQFAGDELEEVFKSCKVVAVYSAVGTELPCDEVVAFFRKKGKRICYPRVNGNQMDFYEVTDESSQMQKGAYNILEPMDDTVKVEPEMIDLMVVPAIAFNDEGIRLGQGGGYYDRYLARCENIGKIPYTIGVCYDFQIYSALPVEEHDKAVDCIFCVYTGDDE